MADLDLSTSSRGAAAYRYGAGGHAMVVSTVLEDLGIEVAGMFEDRLGNSHPLSERVLPGFATIGEPVLLDHPTVLAIGDNAVRMQMSRLISSGFLTPVHPSAIVARRVDIGAGTVVLQGSVIQHNARIGSHVLINTAASIDHDTVIGDFAHISPHATLCGHVEIGEGTHVGAGATVIPSVKVGRWATIGAGAVVTEDIPDGATAVGVPARLVGERVRDVG